MVGSEDTSTLSVQFEEQICNVYDCDCHKENIRRLMSSKNVYSNILGLCGRGIELHWLWKVIRKNGEKS